MQVLRSWLVSCWLLLVVVVVVLDVGGDGVWSVFPGRLLSNNVLVLGGKWVLLAVTALNR